MIVVGLQAKNEAAARGVRIFVGGIPFKVSAEEEIAGGVSERQPVIPAQLRPIVAEVIQLSEPAGCGGQIAFLEVCLDLSIPFFCMFCGDEVRRLRRTQGGRWSRRIRGSGGNGSGGFGCICTGRCWL